MKKISIKLEVSTILLFFILVSSVSTAESPPFPGLPHEFWGTVKDENGIDIQDGSIVKAVVDGETYQTTVKNGVYGFNKDYYPPKESDSSPFYVEDPDNDNEGKTIYFYVNGINTSQTYQFVSGGVTRLDLVVPDGNHNNRNNQNSGGAGLNSGYPLSGENNERLHPVADAKGPYRGRLNETIIFYGFSSYDPDGQIVNYSWDFGDNSTSYSKNPSHVYNTTGVFHVSLLVTDNDGLQDTDNTTATVFIDFDQDGWSDEEEEYYGTNSTDSTDYPLDNDGDYIPDQYDRDDDNDGLTDEEEIFLNSDPKNYYDVKKILNEFGTFFFVDTDNNKIFDIYYNLSTRFSSDLSTKDNISYLVDINGDGNWDYVYNSANGTIKKYRGIDEDFDPNIYYIFILIVIILIVSIVLYLRKNKRVSE